MKMAKKVFMEKNKLFTGKMKLELKMRIMKCSVWSVALKLCRWSRDVDVLTETDRQDFEAFKMWIWRRMEKIS